MTTKVTNSVSSEDLFAYLSTKFNLPENVTALSINVLPLHAVSINFEYFDGKDILTGYEVLTYKETVWML